MSAKNKADMEIENREFIVELGFSDVLLTFNFN